MTRSIPLLILLASPLLAACGGSGVPAIINVDNAVLTERSDTVTLSANNITVTLPVDPDFDRGPFTGAAELNEEGQSQILAFSESETSFVAFLINRETGTTADSFFGTKVASGALPKGSATLTGTYVGAFINEVEDTSKSYIVGDATLNVDLDAMTIGGGVTNMTSELFDSGLVFTLNDELNIVFPDAQIQPNGTFAAIGEHSVTNDENDRETKVTTDWSGLIGGAGTVNDLDVVGRVDTVSVTEGVNVFSDVTSTARQSGVFVAGH